MATQDTHQDCRWYQSRGTSPCSRTRLPHREDLHKLKEVDKQELYQIQEGQGLAPKRNNTLQWYTHTRQHLAESSSGERSWVSCWNPNWTWARSENWIQWLPTASRDESARAKPGNQRKLLSPFTQHSLDNLWLVLDPQ